MTAGFGNAEVISDLDRSSCNGILKMQGVHKKMGREKVETTGTGQTVAQRKYWVKNLKISVINVVHSGKRGILLSVGICEDQACWVSARLERVMIYTTKCICHWHVSKNDIRNVQHRTPLLSINCHQGNNAKNQTV